MKSIRLLLLSLGLIFSISVRAQLADGSIAPNFTLTDIDGNTHELYDYLDQGRAVLLDFFGVWCGPCQDHASELENAYQMYGPNGDNSMMFLALESDDSTTDTQCHNYNGFQWSTELSYPIINNTSSVPDNYQITFYPTIYVVCPNRVITEVGQVNADAIGSFIDANCEIALNEMDLAVNDILTNSEQCSGDINPIVELKNVGSNTVNGVNIDLYLNGNLIESINWLGSIGSSELEQIQFTSINGLSSGEHQLEAVISPDDNNGNNSLTVGVDINQFESSVITLDITFDNYPSETSWNVQNSAGELVYSGSGYSDANSSISETLSLDENECYTFSIYDSYGDGICCSYGDGSYSLSVDGFSISGGEFLHSDQVTFSVGGSGNLINSQTIELSAGWSIFSTYMQPANMDLTNILADISNLVVIVKDYTGLAYLPDWDYNGIGNLNNNQGYQIKVSENCSFDVTGTYIDPTNNSVALESGWNIMSYLRLEPAPTNLVFNSLSNTDAIVIVKDSNGAAYLPDWDFNGIGNLEPDKGYLVKTNFDCELIYNPNGQDYE
jgi:thiol-disulfide isomerase/thioredoxin